MSTIFDEFPDLVSDEFVSNYNLESCHTFLSPSEPPLVLDVAVALIQSTGNIAQAAKKVGRSRRQVDNAIARNPKLQMLLEDIQESFIDAVEDLQKLAALSGDANAQRFFLTTKGKGRGYNTRSELTGKDGNPLEVETVDAKEILLGRLNRLNERSRPADPAQGNVPGGS